MLCKEIRNRLRFHRSIVISFQSPCGVTVSIQTLMHSFCLLITGGTSQAVHHLLQRLNSPLNFSLRLTGEELVSASKWREL